MAYRYKKVRNLESNEYEQRIRDFINKYPYIKGYDGQTKKHTKEIAKYCLEYVKEQRDDLLEYWYNYLIEVERREEATDIISFGLKTEIQIQSILYYLYKKQHDDFEHAYFSESYNKDMFALFCEDFTGYTRKYDEISQRNFNNYLLHMINRDGEYKFNKKKYAESEYIYIKFDDYIDNSLKLIIEIPSNVKKYIYNDYDTSISINFDGNVAGQWEEGIANIKKAVGKLRSQFGRRKKADLTKVEYYKNNPSAEYDYERILYTEPPKDYKLIFEDITGRDISKESLNRYQRFVIYIL